MKEGPDITKAAAMMGDPARANMLMALMSGMALTGAELAREANVTPSTASGHLAKLEAAGLVIATRQGRCCYYRIAEADVAHAIEALVTVAARAGHFRTRPGPKDAAMREARSCYDHLAGRHAVALFEYWVGAGVLTWRGDVVELTAKGRSAIADLGIDVAALERRKRPLCRTCIDWSERRNHLGGAVGAAVLERALGEGWAARVRGERTIVFAKSGQKEFTAWYSGNGTSS